MKTKKRISVFEKFMAAIGFAAIAAAVLLIPYNFIKNHFLKNDYIKVRAITIDDKNYFGNNTRRYSYSYKFNFRGKEYTGNTLNSKYQVGDSVWVRVVPSIPLFNRIDY